MHGHNLPEKTNNYFLGEEILKSETEVQAEPPESPISRFEPG
jgi:hypothetical protein